MEATSPITDIAREVGEGRLVDTHEHLSQSKNLNSMDDLVGWSRTLPRATEREWVDDGPDILQDLFGYYVSFDLRTAGADQDSVDRALDPSFGDVETRFACIRDAWEVAQHTGHGEAVRLLAREVYGLEEITPAGLEQAQARLDELQRPGAMLGLLRDTARLDHVQIDDVRWVCQPDESGPEFFLHDLSWWRFCNGAIEVEPIRRDTGVEVRSLEDLREAMTLIFERFAPFAVAVKSQHAYQRTLRWEERSDDDAARALAAVLMGVGVDEATRLVLGDWCWARGVELAIQHDLPVKLHTGYYAGNGAMPVDRIRAGHLCPLLMRYPEARFVLMHIAYPYSDELVAIAKHYPNVWVDLCWAWTVDPYTTADFLRRFLHAVPISKLFAFGGDTHRPTAAVAYSLQARRWLTRTLEAAVADGDFTERQALGIARRVMYENQYACFDIEGKRRSGSAKP